ncbi:MAG: hypothetical protein AAFR38_10115 [Planctomycetota bacterium]
MLLRPIAIAACGLATPAVAQPFGGPTNGSAPLLPVDFFWNGTEFERNLFEGQDNRLDPTLPIGLSPVVLPETGPGEFPAFVSLTAMADIDREFLRDLITYGRRDDLFASGQFLTGQDAVWAFRFDAGATPDPTFAQVSIVNRVGNGVTESGYDFVLIGDTGQFENSPNPSTDGRGVEFASYFGGQFAGSQSLDALTSVDETGRFAGMVPDLNLKGNARVTYYVTADRRFGPPVLLPPSDFDIVIERPAIAGTVPINEGFVLTESRSFTQTTVDDRGSEGTLGAPQGRRASFVRGYRDAEGIVQRIQPLGDELAFGDGNEYHYCFTLQIASDLSIVDPEPLESRNDPAFFVLTENIAITQDASLDLPPEFMNENPTVVGPALDGPLTVVDYPSVDERTIPLGFYPPGVYYLIVEGRRPDGPFSFDLELDRVGCNPGDLAAPFGIMSQTDVARFVELFFTGYGPIAALAPPVDVGTQADVSAFVSYYFSGCSD